MWPCGRLLIVSGSFVLRAASNYPGASLFGSRVSSSEEERVKDAIHKQNRDMKRRMLIFEIVVFAVLQSERLTYGL